MALTSDYNLGPHEYPRGWFMVADADDVTRTPQAVRFFGKDLALYRGESGRVVMLDAYCPHMGTHLAANTTSFVIRNGTQVEGDNIRCPYHAWRFGADGKCNEIPYFNGPIPAGARVKSWRVQERYGSIFAWHDMEEGEPDCDLPELAEWDEGSWVHWKLDKLGTLPCHSQELIDNMADAAHLGPTHGAPCEYFRNEITGIVCRQLQGGKHATIAGGGLLETDTYYTGPGILFSRFVGLGSIMYITHTPVDDGCVRAWHGLLVKSPNNPPTEQDIAAARVAQEYSRAAFAQDFEIWANKSPALQILQVPTDGPFARVRAWYKQFYHPRAEVAALQAKANGVFTVRDLPSRNDKVA
ncbi:MAG TPA: Rieske 2Fe-2S domain-containing protein [Acetobacteraceae bacterium]|nr:Rieske 2Fe-2S domain-containing protein [Acetobacteraceae bacterium]